MSVSRKITKIAASLDVIPFRAAKEDNDGTECPNCRLPLTITQPDPWLPERLIAACRHCKHWFLIDMLPDNSQGMMLRLPDVQVIRNLSRQNPSAGISMMTNEREDQPKGPLDDGIQGDS